MRNLLRPGTTVHALGPKYSYSHELVLELLAAGIRGIRAEIGHADFSEVLGAAKDGGVAFLPFVNPSTGIMWPHIKYSALSGLGSGGCAGKVVENVACMAESGTCTLKTAERVLSKKQALAQVSGEWLREHGLITEERPSSSEAMNHVATEQDPALICVGSPSAARSIKGLKVVGDHVGRLHEERNVTGFQMLSRNLSQKLCPHHDNHMVAWSVTGDLQKVRGAVRGVMNDIDDLRSFYGFRGSKLSSTTSGEIELNQDEWEGEEGPNFYWQFREEDSNREFVELFDEVRKAIRGVGGDVPKLYELGSFGSESPDVLGKDLYELYVPPRGDEYLTAEEKQIRHWYMHSAKGSRNREFVGFNVAAA